MKKTLTILALVATLAAAFGASMKEAVVAKILAIQVKQFITPEFIAGVVNARTPTFSESSCEFYAAYHTCRAQVYEKLFVNETINEGSDNTDWSQYIQFRTITVAVMKQQLHSGNTLSEVYDSVSDGFIKAIAGTGKEFRTNLHVLITDAIEQLDAVKVESLRRRMEREIAQQNFDFYGTDNAEIKNMLSMHAPAADIAKKVLDNKPLIKSEGKDVRKDLDMARFALRRFNEGGAPLVDKYLSVLRRAEKDVAGTL